MNSHTKRQNSDASYLWSLNLVKPNTTLTIQSQQLHKHRSVISASVEVLTLFFITFKDQMQECLVVPLFLVLSND